MDPLQHVARPAPARSGLQVVSEEARDLAERLVREQKQRWAEEIHDGLTQTVTVAVMEVQRLREQVASDPEAAAATLDHTVAELRAALADVREALYELSGDHDAVEDDESATEALRATIEEVAHRFDLSVDPSFEGTIDTLPAPAVAVAGLVIREAMTNAAKHAGIRTLGVRAFGGPDGITVEVTDAGRGADDTDGGADAAGPHFGMRMMRRRVEDAGGIMAVRSAPGEGTSVLAHVPARTGAIR